MAGVPWTPDEIEKLKEWMSNPENSPHDVAEWLGRSLASVRLQWQRHCGGKYRTNGKVKGKPAPPSKAAPGSSIGRELKAFKNSATKKPNVKCEYEGDPSAAEKWEVAERDNARHVHKALTRHKFSVDFPANEPIAIAFVSDQHIAPGTPVDLARMRADAEYIRDTPNLYALLLGDGIDGHIKHRAAIIAARSTPSDQLELYSFYLSIMASKVLALCSGNHDAWIENFAGVDAIQWLANQNKICYSAAEFRIAIMVAKQTYQVAARHQYRMNSSFNQTHCVKQWLRLGDEEFDIGAIGHHHESAVEGFEYRRKTHWACRPGSYQITSAHSRQFGYNSVYPSCPTFLLFPGHREIVGFKDMRMAGKVLQAELNG